jgi:hypothetical protein
MHSFPLVEVSGDARQMGYQHGAQAAELIGKYLFWIEKMCGRSRQELIPGAMELLPYIQDFSPLYVEEIRGLAQGADISFEEALLCQVRGEAARAAPDGCTAFAFSGAATLDGQPLAGQNQDLPPEFADLGIVLHLKPTDGRPRAMTFTFAGQLGYMGTNQHGVSHFANGLNGPWQPGLPHYPLKRVLLEQQNVEQCLKILEQRRTCSCANMVFCDGKGTIADVEIRPDRVYTYDDEDPDCRLHTNHWLVPATAQTQPAFASESKHRLERLRHLVQAKWGKITTTHLKAVLADHKGDPGAICRHGEGGTHSVAGYIAEPARGLFHVRRGHGCSGTWTSYTV